MKALPKEAYKFPRRRYGSLIADHGTPEQAEPVK